MKETPEKYIKSVQSSGGFIVNIDLARCSDIFKTDFEQINEDWFSSDCKNITRLNLL